MNTLTLLLMLFFSLMVTSFTLGGLVYVGVHFFGYTITSPAAMLAATPVSTYLIYKMYHETT